MSEKNRITVYCATCGKPKSIIMALYLRNKSKKFYCDKTCFTKKEIVFCSQCGKEKQIQRNELKDGKSYFCNRECHDKYQRGGIDNYIVKCGNCGVEKEVTPFDFNKYKVHFCNKECYDEWQVDSGHVRGENSPRYRSIIKKCDQCGKEITVAPWQKNSSVHQFCSLSCRSLWVSKNMSGENSPLWLGGYNENDYGPEFNKELKRRLYKRDGFKCQICGKRRRTQRLCEHHIDYDKKNNKYSMDLDSKEGWFENNLITLCDSCHTRTNFNRDFWKRWFKSSSGFWFASRCI